MRVGGRGRCAGALQRIVCLLVSVQLSAGGEYGVPVEIKAWDTGRTPLAHMVDVTNGFGLKVLAEHNFLNDNNIAFSPYGLMGILVALYEGIDGESSYQLQRAMPLPWNRNVMRIGFRDIHRTLKTYFVPEEGFLAGLALNNDNVTFNEGYKKILRFYGFDLDNNEQLPTLAPTNDTNSANVTTTEATAADVPQTTTATATTAATSAMDTASTQGREDPTTNPNAETLSDVDIRGPSTTPTPSSAPNSESTTMSTEQPTEPTTQNTVSSETTAAINTASTPASTAEETTTSIMTSQAETESLPPQSSTIAVTDEPTANNEVGDTTLTVSTTSASSAPDTTTVTSTTGEVETTQTTKGTTLTETSTEMSTMTTPVIATTNLETLERRKRSLVDFIFTNPPYVDDYLFHRSFDIPIASDPLSPDFGGNKMFLVNGLRNVQVTYMHYDTILEHAYLPHLEASALRLPLDSERYYLLVILPTRAGAGELGRLLARMARESDLSDVCSALRPRRVRAIVPSFTVKGHVTLTTDLQKLGIRDVFEPRQRDFTPMTQQAGVYVRSIEQVVSVAIRKYRATDSNNKYVSNRHPVTFPATYPFLYFVVDSSIHVALMAGKMVDPLNSRIL